MELIGFEQSVAEPCVYVRIQPPGTRTTVAVYVVDLILITKTAEQVKETLMTRFKMKDTGKLLTALGSVLNMMSIRSPYGCTRNSTS